MAARRGPPAATLADELMGMGIECYRVMFPHRMDANEYGLKVQPASKTLGMLVNTAHWLGKGKAPERETIEIRPVPPESKPVAPKDSEPSTNEEPIEPAAKEEAIQAEPGPPGPEEPVFPLAANAPLPPIHSPVPADDMA